MIKGPFFHIIFFLLLSGAFNAVSAHTINHDLEQMYQSGFLPLFVMSMLLPFVALGVLSFGYLKLGYKHIPQNSLFFATLTGGFAVGLAVHIDLQFALFDSLYVLLAGILLLLLGNSNATAIKWMLLPAGLSLGIEYALLIVHAHDFRWLYISLLAAGIIIFLGLSRFEIAGRENRRFFQYGAGIIFILSGIVLLLMS